MVEEDLVARVAALEEEVEVGTGRGLVEEGRAGKVREGRKKRRRKGEGGLEVG